MEAIKQQLQMVIFDLDGVIVDSEPLHDAAKKWILEQNGVMEKPDLSWSVGIPGVDIWTRLIKQYGLRAAPAEFERQQYEFILSSIREKNIPESRGLKELLAWLATRNITVGLASSSDRFYVERILKHYELTDRFQFVTAGDEVPQKKPAPDVYRNDLSRSGIHAGQAVAIEDSASGIQAAAAAGMHCIGYRNPTSGNQDLSKADWIVNSLADVPKVLLDSFTF